jgi:hypothetical protein
VRKTSKQTKEGLCCSSGDFKASIGVGSFDFWHLHRSRKSTCIILTINTFHSTTDEGNHFHNDFSRT